LAEELVRYSDDDDEYDDDDDDDDDGNVSDSYSSSYTTVDLR